MKSTTHLIQLPPDAAPQIFGSSKEWFVLMSPILVPIIGVGVFGIVMRLVVRRLMEPSAVSGTTGRVARIVEKKKLIALLLSAVGAFLTFLALQPPELRQGFMFPFQILTGLVISDRALYALVTTLFGIAAAVLFL